MQRLTLCGHFSKQHLLVLIITRREYFHSNTLSDIQEKVSLSLQPFEGALWLNSYLRQFVAGK
jgi:hypothetical protein